MIRVVETIARGVIRGALAAQRERELWEPELLFCRLKPSGIIPTRATEDAAGWDLATPYPFVWNQLMGSSFRVELNIGVCIPKGFVGLMRARSGAAFRLEHVVFEGTVDADYVGGMSALLLPLTGYEQTLTFNRGDRVAQLVVVPAPKMRMRVVDELPDTKRGAAGFGSTGR